LAAAHAIAFAQATPSISISPTSGPCGTFVQVTGTGFPPNTALAVGATSAGGRDVDLTPRSTTDSQGSLHSVTTIPTYPCPFREGTIIFACVPLGCSPAANADFTVIQGAPVAGTGGVSSPSGMRVVLALALAGTAFGLGGLSLRRKFAQH
jgi:hypothetical protein